LSKTTHRDHPLHALPREDLDLIVELVLQGGSLKDLASVYGVSYPTIRARLDRVIARLRDAVQGRAPDPMSELLGGLVERGELSVGGARGIRDLWRQAREEMEAHARRHVGAESAGVQAGAREDVPPGSPISPTPNPPTPNPPTPTSPTPSSALPEAYS